MPAGRAGASASGLSWRPTKWCVNPTLVLQRGPTYRFDVTVNGRPFRIASSAGGPSHNVGGNNNDAMMGTVTFEVPMDAPSQLHHHRPAPPNTDGIIDIQ